MFDAIMPVVQPEICFSIEDECRNVSDIDTVKRLYKKVKSENPIVAIWIKNWAKQTKDRIGSMACALITYRLIQSQIEADIMNGDL